LGKSSNYPNFFRERIFSKFFGNSEKLDKSGNKLLVGFLNWANPTLMGQNDFFLGQTKKKKAKKCINLTCLMAHWPFNFIFLICCKHELLDLKRKTIQVGLPRKDATKQKIPIQLN
jgi:hypothetical protein